MTEFMAVAVVPQLFRLHNKKEPKGKKFLWIIKVPSGCRLPEIQHQNLVPEVHEEITTDKIALFKISSHKGNPVQTPNEAYAFFSGQSRRHPLNMAPFDYVHGNISYLLEQAGLTEEINLVLFIASAFPSNTPSARVVVGMQQVARGVWKALENGYDVGRQFDKTTTVFAIYKA